MYFLKFILKSILLIIFLGLVSSSFSKELTILTEESPPAQYLEDGKVKGIAVEIAREIMKILKVDITIKIRPWARAYQSALIDSNTLLFSMTRTESREKLFKWVGPILKIKWILVAKKNSEIKIDTLDQAKYVKRIGAYKGDAREQFLKENGFQNLYSTVQPYQLIKMLLNKRLDLMITSNLGLIAQTKKLNKSIDSFKVVHSIKEVDLYMAFSKYTEDRIVKKWSKAFNSLKKNGILEKIYKKWSINQL